jgi:hypothetical protein
MSFEGKSVNRYYTPLICFIMISLAFIALEVTSMSISVLGTFQKGNLYRDPFPHLIIRDALPNAVCDQLIKEYITLDGIFRHLA